MNKFHRVALGALAGFAFAAGYIARIGLAEPGATIGQNTLNTPNGSQLASSDLRDSGIDLRPIDTLTDVLTDVRQHYVEQITQKTEGVMTYDALKYMLASLDDPNTRFVKPEMRKTLSDARNGVFHGIGAAIAIKKVSLGSYSEERLLVMTVYPGGASQRAGIKPGDFILSIDGKSVLPYNPLARAAAMRDQGIKNKTEPAKLRKQLEAELKRIDNGVSILEAADNLITDDGKTLKLTISRTGLNKKLDAEVKTAQFEVAPIESSMIDDKSIAYIRFNYLTPKSAEAFDSEMKRLQGSNVSGLALDIRNVHSGELSTVLAVSKWFVPGKTLSILAKSRGRKQIVKPQAESAAWKKPLAILINENTYGAPEVLAYGIDKNTSATLVGRKTFGNFADTSLTELEDGSAVILTTGQYMDKTGKKFAGGIAADKDIAQMQAGDSQLMEAVKALTAGKGKG